MTKGKCESKDEVLPLPYRIATVILIIGFYLAGSWAATQESPWPLIYVISIGIPLHVLLVVSYFVRRRRMKRHRL
ncbi:MAG: hypothetical protein OEX77_06730 [Candidatus Bathyarchaeota archaeon]|nr:hypothetical protein [Candidatus Bathyarchaeota archaeon]